MYLIFFELYCANLQGNCRNTYGIQAVANREGKSMMFLIRTGFWLIVLILLLPTDESQQKEIYGTAQTAMNDVVTFCDRNPETCAKGQDAFAVLVQKAQYGAQVVMNLVESQTAALDGAAVPGPVPMDPAPVNPVPANPVPMDGAVMPVPATTPLEPATWEASQYQDTLNAQDREAAWGGPGI